MNSVAEPTLAPCVHWWLCHAIIPGQDTVPGVCKRCGEAREFVAFSPVDLFNPRTAMSAEKRKNAMAQIGKPGKTVKVYA